ncbi:TRAP transporter substrate-binding protein [Telmatospirillum sp. J64-1]|uniref:TRAP transporter substrate-binding protein n=1 Tax=Telmatospirillum sp. J64-1 TaxID=2502183 RepID=UPI00115ED33A|nr:TRAP transporter substrate-binding protein [Telmatospirillum sp. J64-1]
MNFKKIAIAAVTALAFTSSAVAAKDLRLGLITPPSHQWSKTATEMAEEIAKETNGEINILIFPSGQLGTEAQMMQMLQSGALDMAFLAIGEVANRRADFGAFFAPFLVKDVDQASRLLRGETAQKMLEDLRPLGLVGLGYGMAGMRQIVMRGKVASQQDLAGRKVRTMPIQAERDFWSKVGAAPTPIPLPSLYDAFANGQVDGMQIDFEGTWNTRYVDHAGTVIESNHMMLPMVAVASARTWQGLTEEQRDLIHRKAAERLDDMVKSYATIDQDYLDKIKEHGANVIKVDRSFFGPSVDAWYEEWRAKAPSLEALEKEVAAY